MSMSPIISGLIGGLISVLLTVYIAKRVGKAGKSGELRFGGFMWGLAVACLVLAFLPVAVTLAGNEREFWAKLALFVGFAFGAAYCFGEAAFVRGSFNDESIEFHTPWTGIKRENWRDLVSVDFVASCSWYTLTFASGKKIRLSQYLQGHMSAVDMANAKLATSSR
jgi:xanthine/uracil permease